MSGPEKRRPGIAVASAVIGVLIAALQAVRMIDHVRAVDIVALFGGGMAAGAGLSSAIARFRDTRGGGA